MAATGSQGFRAGHDQNITRTRAPVNPCAFIESADGEPPQFCGAPAARGGPYCARHRALCRVAAHTSEGRRVLAAMARDAAVATPGIVPVLAPETFEPATPEDVALDLDLPYAEDAA
jgi:hypothetical protein